MAYFFDSDSGELRRQDGSAAFTVLRDVDPEMFGYLATPRWLDAINAGRGTVDEQAKTVSIPELGKTWTAHNLEDRADLAALIPPLMTITGWQAARAIAFAKWLLRFIREVA